MINSMLVHVRNPLKEPHGGFMVSPSPNYVVKSPSHSTIIT